MSALAIFASRFPTISAGVTNQMVMYRIGWLTQSWTPTAAADMAAINTFEPQSKSKKWASKKKSIAYKELRWSVTILKKFRNLIHAMSGKIHEMKLNIDKNSL